MTRLARGGVALVLLYTVLITGADAIVKTLGQSYSAAQMFAVSGFVVVLLCLVCGRASGEPLTLLTLRPVTPGLMALRSGATVVAAVAFFEAFRQLQFAEVFLFVGLMPLISALMAGPVLGERIRMSSWIALGFGGIGMMCLFPQGWSSVGSGHLVALLAAISGTYSMVLARLISRQETRATLQVLYPNLALALVMLPPLFGLWVPMSAAHLGIAVLYGVLLFAARLVLVRALTDVPAHVATSLMKLQFVWMVVIGFALFGEVPGLHVFAGVMLVIGSGLLLVYEDRLEGAWRAVARDFSPGRG
ncbi:MAG: hypothetical protein CSA70_10100 [Rhodobacterales bacterium]|nr:MAG: hypothetical protein CSA70_10100 [Rhodobacterales bacterium]